MTPSATLARPLPGEHALSAAARLIIEEQAERLPDLTGVRVLLPSLYAAQPLARALAAAAGDRTLLLPEFTTLPRLAATAPLPLPVLPDSARASLLYAALRERRWLAEGQELWALTAELLRLFDELTLHDVGLPEDLSAFTRMLEEAYRARAGAPLAFEARLVHELWYALKQATAGRLDQASSYVLGLAHVAETADRPLYAIGLGTLTPVEVAFLARYGERAAVRLMEPSWLPPTVEEAADGLSAVLAAAFGEDERPLAVRAATLARRIPESPLAHRVRLFAAHNLEEEAQAADVQLRLWLAQGRRALAVVAQDRLVARRLRALLERSGVLVADETGWTLSTTAASSIVMRWPDLLADDFYHEDLLDFLKSPLLFADSPHGDKEAVYDLEQLIRAEGIVSTLAHYRRAAGGRPCAALLQRLEEVERPWRPLAARSAAQPLAAWLGRLMATLDALGVRQALALDPAGAQLITTLNRLADELADDDTRFTFGEWRRWLDGELERATFRDNTIVSPVVFTHLAATRLRPFDGVVLLGCGSDKLPSPPADGLFFNQSVRAQLGLPTRAQALKTELSHLAALLTESREVLVTWQRQAAGEERLVSNWFDLLDTVHGLAYGTGLADTRLSSLLSFAPAAPDPAPRAATMRPAPRLAARLLPDTVSASGYNSLLACPYQFFARHVLRLNELDEVSLEMEKRDFGEVVHRILLAFHRAHGRPEGEDRVALETDLHRIAEREFRDLLELNYTSHAWFIAWRKLLPAYVDWQLARSASGWRWQDGEVRCERKLPRPDGGTLTLRGTLDRLDIADGKLAVLDYKTRAPDALRKTLKARGEDVQLPVYALLAEEKGQVVEAAYVSLHGTKPCIVPLAEDPLQLGREIAERLVELFALFEAGTPALANGIEEACRYCEMRGLCRRGHWTDTP